MTGERRLSVCLTFDFDAASVWIVDTDNPAAISRGEFGPVAIPRILALLEKHDATATFFVPGHTALAAHPLGEWRRTPSVHAPRPSA